MWELLDKELVRTLKNEPVILGKPRSLGMFATDSRRLVSRAQAPNNEVLVIKETVR